MAAISPRRSSLLRWFTDSAKTHTSLPLFAIALLALIGWATMHVIATERAAARIAAQASSQELAEAFEAHVERNLGTIDRALKTLKYAVGLHGQGPALGALNQQGLTPSGLLFTVNIVDANGLVVASNCGQEQADISRQPSFQYHRQTNNKLTFVSQVQQGASEGEWLLSFSRRLNDTGGQFSGVVIVAVDPSYLTSFAHDRLGKLGALGVYGNDGVLRALAVGEKVSWGQRGPGPAEVAPARQPITSAWDGQRRYVSLRPLVSMPLVAMVGLAESEQMAAFEARRTNILWIAASASAILVLIVTLVCLWSYQITRTRERARRAEETYAAASKASMDAFFVLRSVRDAKGDIIEFQIEEVNKRAETLLGATREALIGCPFSQVLPELHSGGIFEELVALTLAGGVRECEWQRRGSGAGTQWLHRQVVGVEDGVVAIVRDITERKLTEERIRHIAHHDELTGLANRVLVRDRLEQALRQARRRERSVALVFIDLDGFKAVNDTLGHDAGDELLKVVGARMAECLRSEDTVGRFGGDEFVIVLADQGRDPLALVPLLNKIRERVNQPVTLGAQAVTVGCSMGVALCPATGMDPNELMKHADAAMYRAKQSGKNNFQFHDEAPLVVPA